MKLQVDRLKTFKEIDGQITQPVKYKDISINSPTRIEMGTKTALTPVLQLP